MAWILHSWIKKHERLLCAPKYYKTNTKYILYKTRQVKIDTLEQGSLISFNLDYAKKFNSVV